MNFLPLFDDLVDPPPQAARLGPRLRTLAGQGIYFGTSSWKYEGWLGSIYSTDRYTTRGKFSQAKFDARCLGEYAETFPIVCGDFSFYQFPTPAYWSHLFGDTPESLLLGFKVPEEITVAAWPTHARYGVRAGRANPSFLDARLLDRMFLRPLAGHSERVATLIFEFGAFSKQTFGGPRAFVRALDGFLGALPGGFRYAVEVRNPEFLGPEYFASLADHNVAHVANAWTKMPGIDEQIAMPGSAPADFLVARALLKKGRKYEEAVAAFQPYERVQEPDHQAREGLRNLAVRGRILARPTFLFVNNRLEGHAPTTIEAVATALLEDRPGLNRDR